MRRPKIASNTFALLPTCTAFAISRSSCDSSSSSSSPEIKCRYVVVGSEGTAGRSAMKVLQHHAFRKRDIMGIDPISLDSASRHSVESLDIPKRLLTLSNGSKVNFEHVLIATGRRIPRNMKKIEDNKLLHLGELDGSIDPALFRREHVLLADDPFVVDELVKRVSRGEHVTIVGGSTTDNMVIELAMKLASTGRRAGYDNVVSILCPSSGILSQRLPRYFSLALNRRLSTLGVEVVRYGQLRYIAGIDALVAPEPGECEGEDDDDNGNDNDVAPASNKTRSKYGKVALFCSHTYDSLNTVSFETDVVALVGTSPTVGGSNEAGSSGQLHFGLEAGLESGTVGGIVCNRSLQAAAGVWLAGDVANIDLGSVGLGRGCWSGIEHARETGRVAALNMLGGSLLYNKIPTDYLVCTASPFVDPKNESESCGINKGSEGADNLISLTFVGHCSAALDSHGFWWNKRTTPGTPDLPAFRAARVTKGTTTGLGLGGTEMEAVVSGTERRSTGALLQDQFFGYFGLSPKERDIPEGAHLPMTAKGREGVTRVIPTGSEISNEIAASRMISDKKTSNSKAKDNRTLYSPRFLKAPKRLPRTAPMGAGIVFYLGPDNTIAGVLLAGLAPSQTSGDTEVIEAYHELVNYARSKVGEKFNPYLEEGSGGVNAASGRPSHQQLQQGVFLFGHPGLSNGGRIVSVSSQLELIATEALRKYDGRLRKSGGEGPSRPSCRAVKGSSELQRSVIALMDNTQTKVTPVPALREKLTAGKAHNSNKDRLKAAYSTAMKSNEIKATWSPTSK